MLNSRNCLIHTLIEKIPTKFSFYFEDEEHKFNISVPGGYFALGSFSLETIKEIGHLFTWFDESKKDQVIKLNDNRIEVYVDGDQKQYYIDIWFHWNNIQMCFGQFSLEDFRKLGSFFVEYGLYGHEKTNDDIYCDPVEKYLENLLKNGKVTMEELNDIDKLRELADNAEDIPGFKIIDLKGEIPQDYLDQLFEIEDEDPEDDYLNDEDPI
jgi:hypothetical protein